MALFDLEEVQKVAELARLELRGDEVAKMTSDLNVINDAISAVTQAVADEEAKTGKPVEATSHPLPLDNVFREDVPATLKVTDLDACKIYTEESPYSGDLLTVEQAVSGAPQAEDGQFVAPQILGED